MPFHEKPTAGWVSGSILARITSLHYEEENQQDKYSHIQSHEKPNRARVEHIY